MRAKYLQYDLDGAVALILLSTTAKTDQDRAISWFVVVLEQHTSPPHLRPGAKFKMAVCSADDHDERRRR